MKSLNFKALSVVPALALLAGTMIAQTPAAPTQAQMTQQQMDQMQAARYGTPPTAKQTAIMEAALKYNADPNSTLYQTHDPEIVEENGVYYLFPSGCRVSSSTDLIHWEFAYNVFDAPQPWVTPDIIGNNDRGGAMAGGGPTATAPGAAAAPRRAGGHCSAPDVQLINGTYYMYYDVTSFAKNSSAIGVATNKTLDPHSPNFKWEDHGLVVQSVPNRDMWNALDANLIMDRDQPWLVLGSFWGGIKMVKLDKNMMTVAKPEVWYPLASQPRTYVLDETDPGDGTIEGAFIYKHIQYFYLFVSYDYCCRGILSDYKVAVGRSRFVEGPYVDREGKLMTRGGGTIIASADANWNGVGHNSAFTMDGKSIIVMHGYDRRDNGKSKLIIRELKWDRGDWPSLVLSPDLTAAPAPAAPVVAAAPVATKSVTKAAKK